MKTLFLMVGLNLKKRIHLLYDDTTRHFHVITNLMGAMAKRYVCKGCGKGCRSHLTHKCDVKCSDCISTPPCTFSRVRISCASCKRTFRSQTCFDRHMTNKLRRKTVCAQKRNCSNCCILLSHKKNKCYKTYCKNCMQYEMIGHLCYMKPLANVKFFEDTVGNLLTHLCEPRGWCDQVVALEQNARGFDAQFSLKRAILLKWKQE